MRIWCCLCFSEEEEEEEEEEDRKERKGMREGISGTASEEMENDESQNFGLEFSWDEDIVFWSRAAEYNAYRNEGLERDMAFGNCQFEGTNGSLQGFHHLGASSSSGHTAMEVNLNLSLSEEPSSSTALKQDNCDSHNKRPKVQSFSL